MSLCLSGIFNARGQLICFGNSKLQLDNNAPATRYDEMSGANIAGRHRSFASTLVAKIIATSAAAEDSESANGTSFQSPGLRKSTSVDYDALDGSAGGGGGGGNGGGVAVESPAKTGGANGARFTIDKSALLAVDGAGVVSSPEESDDEEEEGSSDDEDEDNDEEESSGEVEDRVEEEEEDDYQFSFDSESKEPTPRRLKTKSTTKPKPKPALKMNKSTTTATAAKPPLHSETVASTAATDYAAVGGAFGTVFKRGAAPVSLSSNSNSFFLGDLETTPRKQQQQMVSNINKYGTVLQLYKVAYSQELRLLHAYSVGPLSRSMEAQNSSGGSGGTIVGRSTASPVPITSASSTVKILSPVPLLASNSSTNNINNNSSSSSIRGRVRSRSNPTPPVPPSSQQQRGPTSSSSQPLTKEEAHDRASACRHNAQMAQQIAPQETGLCQFWNLMAVVLEMLTITDSGCLIDWTHCTLGVALLHRLYKYLCELNDLQTFATAICVLGGVDILVDLLVPYYAKQQQQQQGQESSSEEKERGISIRSSSLAQEKDRKYTTSFEPSRVRKELEYVLYVYNDVLNRWGEQLSAVEVRSVIVVDVDVDVVVDECRRLISSFYLFLFSLTTTFFLTQCCVFYCIGFEAHQLRALQLAPPGAGSGRQGLRAQREGLLLLLREGDSAPDPVPAAGAGGGLTI